jgi:hypothetical protein
VGPVQAVTVGPVQTVIPIYIPTPEARAAGERNLWSFGLSLDEFFDKALALPGFQYEAEPVGLKVWYSDV